MAREPEIGDYVFLFCDEEEVIVEGIVECVSAENHTNGCTVTIKGSPETYLETWGDYFIPKDLLETEMGQLIWNT